jgi:hypothetical protein
MFQKHIHTLIKSRFSLCALLESGSSPLNVFNECRRLQSAGDGVRITPVTAQVLGWGGGHEKANGF